MFKKVFSSVTAILLLVLIGASFAVVGAAGKQVELTFWDENPGPKRTPYLQELIKRFESQNANITVKYVGIPSKSAPQKYNLAIAAGETPDCAGCPGSWVTTLLSQKALLPLDSYFRKWDEKNQISKNYLNQIRSNDVKKKLYMLPNTSNQCCLWYRIDRFTAARLNVPKTWDDYFTAAQKLTTDQQYGLSIRGGSGTDTPLLAGIISYAGLTSFFDKHGKCTLNSPKAVEFVEKYASLYGKYSPKSDLTNGYKEMVGAFDSGVVNMIFHNLGSYGEHHGALKDDQFAAIPYPTGSKKVYMAGVVNGDIIFKNTKHPNEAWKFISFLASQNSQRYWNQKIGQIPTNMQLLKEDWVKNAQHLSTVGNAFVAKGVILVQQPEYLPDYKNIRVQVMDPGFQAVLAGKKTAKQFLDEVAGVLEKSNNAYRKMVKK
jgi:multiple sugar transport system substrate-binding protein